MTAVMYRREGGRRVADRASGAAGSKCRGGVAARSGAAVPPHPAMRRRRALAAKPRRMAASVSAHVIRQRNIRVRYRRTGREAERDDAGPHVERVVLGIVDGTAGADLGRRLVERD